MQGGYTGVINRGVTSAVNYGASHLSGGRYYGGASYLGSPSYANRQLATSRSYGNIGPRYGYGYGSGYRYGYGGAHGSYYY